MTKGEQLARACFARGVWRDWPALEGLIIECLPLEEQDDARKRVEDYKMRHRVSKK